MPDAKDRLPGSDRGDRPGELRVVGIGPGARGDRTLRAQEAILGAEVVTGYAPYVDSVADLCRGEVLRSGMRKEVDRCREALELAAAGRTVALVCSGDAGVYGMAGLCLELSGRMERPPRIEIVPGVTAALSAAASLGAPLMLDHACVSLSDLLVPWEEIVARLEALAATDLAVVLYNPRSRGRREQLAAARGIFQRHRGPGCLAAVVTRASLPDEERIICTLSDLPEEKVGMRSVVVFAPRAARQLDGWLVTPRGYRLEEDAA